MQMKTFPKENGTRRSFSLESIALSHPHTILDTSAFLSNPDEISDALINVVADNTSWGVFSAEEIQANINYLHRLIAILDIPSTKVTPVTVEDFDRWQRRYSTSLHYYNMHQERFDRHHDQELGDRRRTNLELLDDYGFAFNRLIQKTKHHVYRAKEPTHLRELTELYRDLLREGILRPQVIRDRRYLKTQRNTTNRFERDIPIAANLLYHSLADQQPVAFVTRDSDFFTLLPRGLQALLYHQPPEISAGAWRGLERAPITLYMADRDNPSCYGEALHTRDILQRNSLRAI